MKVTAGTLHVAPTTDRSWMGIAAELVKARLTFLVLLTASVGFYLGSSGRVDFLLMFHLLTGTGILACGAATLNQFLERRWDAKMRRTRDRPLPAGQLQPETARVFGVVCCVAGLGYLALLTNLQTSLLGALTVGLYLFFYTPLKRVTWLNTWVGAVPGALPPLMGWVAAHGEITVGGAALFAIQFLWQIPHFLAIAWLYRADYAGAGFRMLSGADPTGRKTGWCAVVHAVLLLGASLLPVACGLAGTVYLAGALALGIAFAGTAVRLATERTLRRARQLFWASILYLPLLFGLLVLDRVRA